MKSVMKAGFVVWVVLASVVQAKELRIDGFSGSGEISWEDVNASGSYTIEWSPSLLQTNWSSDWSQLSRIQATGGKMRVRVPMFFRLRYTPDDPVPIPAAATRAAATGGGVPVVASPVVASPAVVAASATPKPAGRGFSGNGSGSRGDPYQVATLAQFQEVANGLSNHYALLSDIDISGSADWDAGRGFRPIGNASKPFAGVFDGRGHKITGLRIARFGIVTADIALFGATSADAWVGNLSVEDAVVAGCDFVAILVGRNDGTVTDCHVAGVVSGSGSFGGLVGANQGQVVRCSAMVGVRPLWVGNHLGGLVGTNNKGATIRDCYAVGAVTGNENPGGLVGVNGGGTIERCYAFVDVESSFAWSSDGYHRAAGGLVAFCGGAGVIRDCFAAGRASGPVGLPVGLLVGGVESEATIINSFYTASDTVSSVGIGRVFGDAGTVECERVAAVGTALFGRGDAPLKSWDFARTWGMEANAGATAYPRLREPAAGGLTAPK